MSELWPRKMLSEVCDVSRGKTITRKQTVEGDVPVVAGGISSSYSHNTANRPANVITVSGSGANAGFVNFWTTPIFASDCSTILPLDPDQLDVRFVYYAMLNLQDYISKELRRGAAQPHVYAKDLAFLEIPVPPLEVQKQIIRILDNTFHEVSKSLEQINKKVNDADEFYDSYLCSLFNKMMLEHDSKTLNECCAEITVGYVGAMKSKYKEEGIPFLRSKNVRPFSITEDGITFIDETFNNSLSKSMLKPGDLVIVRTGYPGTAAVIPDTMSVANCSDMVIVRTGPEVDPNYLAMFFNSSIGKKLVASNLVGAAQQHFNVGAAKKTKLPLPPIIIQQNVIAESNLVRSLVNLFKSINLENDNNITELRKSILQEAFSGKLTGGIVA